MCTQHVLSYHRIYVTCEHCSFLLSSLYNVHIFGYYVPHYKVNEYMHKGSRKKVSFIVAWPLRPYHPSPLELSGKRNCFLSLRIIIKFQAFVKSILKTCFRDASYNNLRYFLTHSVHYVPLLCIITLHFNYIQFNKQYSLSNLSPLKTIFVITFIKARYLY